jgi:acyl-CoA synthetase (AMP-forming)/AMP-acid ligase II
MNIGDALPRNAQRFPKKAALVDARRSLSFVELHLRTNRLGNYLLRQGLRPGERVGIACGSRAEHLEMLFAVGKIGAVAVPFDYNWSATECEAMIRFLAPKAFILEQRRETESLLAIARQHISRGLLLAIEPGASEAVAYEEALAAADQDDPPVAVDGRDPFLIMITSGTTGFPKGCEVNHETYALRSVNNAITKGLGDQERALLTLPLHFNAGRGSMMGMLYLGGTVYLQEKFDEETFLNTIEEERITYSILVPTLCDRLLRYGRLDRFDTSSLTYLGITGGHLDLALASGVIQRICPQLYESYASTDCGQMTTLGPSDRAAQADTVGRPIWCVLLRIADADLNEVGRGEEGEICVRTPLAIQGYYQNPQATREFFQGGWCHTGDIGFLDDAGYLHVSGRKKNMIKSGGISIFPEEIEEVLRRHPLVADAAVVGTHSAEWGEAVQAMVVLAGSSSCEPDDLIRHCKKFLASYKAPKTIKFVNSLPKTALGKIDRAKLEGAE